MWPASESDLGDEDDAGQRDGDEQAAEVALALGVGGLVTRPRRRALLAGGAVRRRQRARVTVVVRVIVAVVTVTVPVCVRYAHRARA
jgi:hypothetical protein